MNIKGEDKLVAEDILGYMLPFGQALNENNTDRIEFIEDKIQNKIENLSINSLKSIIKFVSFILNKEEEKRDDPNRGLILLGIESIKDILEEEITHKAKTKKASKKAIAEEKMLSELEVMLDQALEGGKLTAEAEVKIGRVADQLLADLIDITKVSEIIETLDSYAPEVGKLTEKSSYKKVNFELSALMKNMSLDALESIREAILQKKEVVKKEGEGRYGAKYSTEYLRGLDYITSYISKKKNDLERAEYIRLKEEKGEITKTNPLFQSKNSLEGVAEGLRDSVSDMVTQVERAISIEEKSPKKDQKKIGSLAKIKAHLTVIGIYIKSFAEHLNPLKTPAFLTLTDRVISNLKVKKAAEDNPVKQTIFENSIKKLTKSQEKKEKVPAGKAGFFSEKGTGSKRKKAYKIDLVEPTDKLQNKDRKKSRRGKRSSFGTL